MYQALVMDKATRDLLFDGKLDYIPHPQQNLVLNGNIYLVERLWWDDNILPKAYLLVSYMMPGTRFVAQVLKDGI